MNDVAEATPTATEQTPTQENTPFPIDKLKKIQNLAIFSSEDNLTLVINLGRFNLFKGVKKDIEKTTDLIDELGPEDQQLIQQTRWSSTPKEPSRDKDGSKSHPDHAELLALALNNTLRPPDLEPNHEDDAYICLSDDPQAIFTATFKHPSKDQSVSINFTYDEAGNVSVKSKYDLDTPDITVEEIINLMIDSTTSAESVSLLAEGLNQQVEAVRQERLKDRLTDKWRNSKALQEAAQILPYANSANGKVKLGTHSENGNRFPTLLINTDDKESFQRVIHIKNGEIEFRPDLETPPSYAQLAEIEAFIAELEQQATLVKSLQVLNDIRKENHLPDLDMNSFMNLIQAAKNSSNAHLDPRNFQTILNLSSANEEVTQVIIDCQDSLLWKIVKQGNEEYFRFPHTVSDIELLNQLSEQPMNTIAAGVLMIDGQKTFTADDDLGTVCFFRLQDNNLEVSTDEADWDAAEAASLEQKATFAYIRSVLEGKLKDKWLEYGEVEKGITGCYETELRKALTPITRIINTLINSESEEDPTEHSQSEETDKNQGIAKSIEDTLIKLIQDPASTSNEIFQGAEYDEEREELKLKLKSSGIALVISTKGKIWLRPGQDGENVNINKVVVARNLLASLLPTDTDLPKDRQLYFDVIGTELTDKNMPYIVDSSDDGMERVTLCRTSVQEGQTITTKEVYTKIAGNWQTKINVEQNHSQPINANSELSAFLDLALAAKIPFASKELTSLIKAQSALQQTPSPPPPLSRVSQN